MADSVKIGHGSDIAPGTGKVVMAHGREIAVFNVQGHFFAIDSTCTHRGGPLGDGELDGEVVTCPLHGARFNVKTGEVLGPPAAQGVRSYPVHVLGSDEIAVELE